MLASGSGRVRRHRDVGRPSLAESDYFIPETQLNGPPTEVVGDPWRALARARELAGREGFVVVTGSQYLVGDLLAGGRRERVSSL